MFRIRVAADGSDAEPLSSCRRHLLKHVRAVHAIRPRTASSINKLSVGHSELDPQPCNKSNTADPDLAPGPAVWPRHRQIATRQTVRSGRFSAGDSG